MLLNSSHLCMHLPTHNNTWTCSPPPQSTANSPSELNTALLYAGIAEGPPGSTGVSSHFPSINEIGTCPWLLHITKCHQIDALLPTARTYLSDQLSLGWMVPVGASESDFQHLSLCHWPQNGNCCHFYAWTQSLPSFSVTSLNVLSIIPKTGA